MKLEHSRVDATTNHRTVQEFFVALQELREKFQYDPDCIWNFDETPFKLDEVAERVRVKIILLILGGHKTRQKKGSIMLCR